MTEDTYRGQANDPLSLNLYTYCHNEPMMYYDPTGHWEEGDDKLSDVQQAAIIQLSNEWFQAETPKERDDIHRQAIGIRSGEISPETVLGEAVKQETLAQQVKSIMNNPEQEQESKKSLGDSDIGVFNEPNRGINDFFQKEVTLSINEKLKKDTSDIENEVNAVDEGMGEDGLSLSVYSIDMSNLTSLQRKMINTAIEEYDRTDNPESKEFWLDSIQKILNPSSNPAFENYLVFHHRATETVNGVLQSIGGTTEVLLGVEVFVSASATIIGIPIGKVAGGYLVADGLSNISGGLSRSWNGIIGSNGGDSWNFMKNIYKKVSPEYGEQAYNLTQIGIGIYSIGKGLQEIPDEAIKFYPRKKNIIKAQNQGLSTNTIILNIGNKVVITEQANKGMILYRTVIDKNKLTTGTLLFGVDVNNTSGSIDSLVDDKIK